MKDADLSERVAGQMGMFAPATAQQSVPAKSAEPIEPKYTPLARNGRLRCDYCQIARMQALEAGDTQHFSYYARTRISGHHGSDLYLCAPHTQEYRLAARE